MERLITIRLYGKLGAAFGRVHRRAVSTTTEAVKALCVTLDGFEEYLLHAKKNGMTFAVFRGRKNIGAEELHDGIGNDEIRIAPVIEGSKKGGLFQTILGAVLVVAGVGLTIFSGGALASFGAQMAWAGAAVMAGGLYQMLSPQPRGLQSREDPDNRPSYAFGGPVNTTAMGNPIGVLWGTREIGGAIISAGIVAEDVA
ncbi:putative tail assembly protein [Edwardsiella phage eiAU-183]|uniref:Putative tail assembly protein n=4 Tax=Viruses TaxID=10239 RepID=W0LI27_9CAUD|nr:tail protein [Edwardsiella phage eiAU-183]YP_009613855.1 tail protein [Edwardsiella phage eiAU]AHG23421.1 putative tail assembly protein [Edwardsiella phage eiAU]AHG23475.1 putative tail assembly protein [Edwardsiella phage eiAU-183]